MKRFILFILSLFLVLALLVSVVAIFCPTLLGPQIHDLLLTISRGRPRPPSAPWRDTGPKLFPMNTDCDVLAVKKGNTAGVDIVTVWLRPHETQYLLIPTVNGYWRRFVQDLDFTARGRAAVLALSTDNRDWFDPVYTPVITQVGDRIVAVSGGSGCLVLDPNATRKEQQDAVAEAWSRAPPRPQTTARKETRQPGYFRTPEGGIMSEEDFEKAMREKRFPLANPPANDPQQNTELLERIRARMRERQKEEKP